MDRRPRHRVRRRPPGPGAVRSARFRPLRPSASRNRTAALREKYGYVPPRSPGHPVIRMAANPTPLRFLVAELRRNPGRCRPADGCSGLPNHLRFPAHRRLSSLPPVPLSGPRRTTPCSVLRSPARTPTRAAAFVGGCSTWPRRRTGSGCSFKALQFNPLVSEKWP